MRRTLVLTVLALAALAGLVRATGGAEGGSIESPSGSVTLEVTITEHVTLPTVVNVSVKETGSAGTPTHEGIGDGGANPGTCSEFGPITLSSGHRYRIHNGKHQWQNKDWPGNFWQEMKPLPSLPDDK